jgi:hypothetical protein
MFLKKLLNSKLSYTSIELEDVAISKKTSSYQSIKVAVNA